MVVSTAFGAMLVGHQVRCARARGAARASSSATTTVVCNVRSAAATWERPAEQRSGAAALGHLRDAAATRRRARRAVMGRLENQRTNPTRTR